MKVRAMAALVVIAMPGWVTGVGWAQRPANAPIVGPTTTPMTDPNAPKVSLQVTADGDYTWTIDHIDQGRITAAMGVKNVMVAPGPREVRATRTDGTKFYRIVRVASEKKNSVEITAPQGRAATKVASHPGGQPVPSPQTTAKSQPPPVISPPSTGTSYPNPSAGNPDMFVRITPQARQARPHTALPGQRTPTANASWQISVIAVPVGGTYYDVKIQMVMTGVGSASSTIEVSDFQPGLMPTMFSATANELGNEAVVCYTARAPSQQTPLRWTGTYKIQSSSVPGMAAFVAAHEPTLEKVSNAPCGGLTAEKAPATPAVEASAAPDNQRPGASSLEATLALERGSRLYNSRRYAEARPLLITACEGGTGADACNSVGFMYQSNLGVAIDYGKAREYYLKSCNDDSSFSCNNLGTLYRDGLGVPRDYVQALQLFEKGCDAGVPEGCEAAGKMYMDHLGVAQDNTRARELYKKACDGELAAGCGDEGYVYAMGLGVPKDSAFAASLFNKACGMGSPNSCFSMGMMYRAGEGVARDPVKSKEYFGKACNMGDQGACGYTR